MTSLKLAIIYLRIGIANEMQYRVNFFMQLLQSLIALGVGLVGLSLVFDHTTSLNGWSAPELLIVMGIFTLMGGFIRSAVQPNMQRLMEEIQQGTLDFALTKPADSQLLVSVREFRFWNVVDILMGLIVVGVGVTHLPENSPLLIAPVPGVLTFCFTLLLGGTMIYCFWLILTSTAFWIIRVDEMVNLFEGVYAAGRWPVGVYPNWLRYTLTFLVPVAFAVTIPAEALTGRLDWLTLIGAFALTVVLFVAARFIWRLGVRNYSGASA